MAASPSVPARRSPVWRPFLWGAIPVILLIPAVAMQFTAGVDWTATDFLFAAVLLGGAAALFELAAWKIRDRIGRLVLAALLLGAVLLIWADGAVGVF